MEFGFCVEFGGAACGLLFDIVFALLGLGFVEFGFPLGLSRPLDGKPGVAGTVDDALGFADGGGTPGGAFTWLDEGF